MGRDAREGHGEVGVDGTRYDTVTAVTGIRDLARVSEPDVWNAVADEIHSGTGEIRFGGAAGTDTVALLAADRFRLPHTVLRVFLPSRLMDQPRGAASAVRVAADNVVELGLPPWEGSSYLRRNDALIEGADRLLAFTDGRYEGGTSYTMDRARELGIEIVVVLVRGTGARANPQIKSDEHEFEHPVYALEEYVSRKVGSPLTDFIWELKGLRASRGDVDYWGRRLAELVASEPALSSAEAIAPMPRRDPLLRSDLVPLARAVAKVTGQEVLPDWLVRTSLPVGGEILVGRNHFGATEHAETMAVEGLEVPDGVVLLDNVVTLGGTMAGAQRTVGRDKGVRAPGLALAYSPDLRLVP